MGKGKRLREQKKLEHLDASEPASEAESVAESASPMDANKKIDHGYNEKSAEGDAATPGKKRKPSKLDGIRMFFEDHPPIWSKIRNGEWRYIDFPYGWRSIALGLDHVFGTGAPDTGRGYAASVVFFGVCLAIAIAVANIGNIAHAIHMIPYTETLNLKSGQLYTRAQLDSYLEGLDEAGWEDIFYDGDGNITAKGTPEMHEAWRADLLGKARTRFSDSDSQDESAVRSWRESDDGYLELYMRSTLLNSEAFKLDEGAIGKGIDAMCALKYDENKGKLKVRAIAPDSVTWIGIGEGYASDEIVHGITRYAIDRADGTGMFEPVEAGCRLGDSVMYETLVLADEDGKRISVDGSALRFKGSIDFNLTSLLTEAIGNSGSNGSDGSSSRAASLRELAFSRYETGGR